MKIINIYGQSGSGKSTVAAGLFNLIKQESNKSVELVTEFAKTLVFSNRLEELRNQFYVSAMQYHNLYLLKDKIDIIVSDSPILLGLVYKNKNEYNNLDNLLLELDCHLSPINIFLHRNNTMDFETIGRLETPEQSDEIGSQIKNILDFYKIEYHSFINDKNIHYKIYEYIKLHNLL